MNWRIFNRNTVRAYYALLLCWMAAAACTFPCRAAEDANRYQDARSGVVITYAADKTMFYAEWRVPPISATAASLDSADVDTALRVVLTGLAKYPPAFLHKSLKTIYLVQRLAYYHTQVGGFGDDESKALFLNFEKTPLNLPSDPSEVYLESSLHHELTHLLIAGHSDKFSAKKWTMLNSAGFHYGKGGLSGIQKHTYEPSATTIYWKQGFASEYGMTDSSEDVASISEFLFRGDERFWKAVDESPVLQKKVDMLAAFYHALDSTFTPAYFRKFVSNSPVPVVLLTVAHTPPVNIAPGDAMAFLDGGAVVMPGSPPRICHVPAGGIGVYPQGGSCVFDPRKGVARRASASSERPVSPPSPLGTSLFWTDEAGWLMYSSIHGFHFSGGILHLNYRSGDTLYFPYGGQIYVPGQAEPETMLPGEKEIYRDGYAVIFNPRP